MMTKQAWTFYGGKASVIQGLEGSNAELEQWYTRVIEFVLKIAEEPEFEVEDNGYKRFPGGLVTDGIKCRFLDKPFEMWSDVPGEIILIHESMGFRIGNELICRLEVLFNRRVNPDSESKQEANTPA